MGLGDVYLGAPVATPVDPRHRLVTTKYNPARTWTPPNVVGIGGAYMCIYGMEGPGGYQLFGRTIQVWNTYRQTDAFTDGKPWLLRFFDQIRFFPVSARRADRMAARLPARPALDPDRGDRVPPRRLPRLPRRQCRSRSRPSRRSARPPSTPSAPTGSAAASSTGSPALTEDADAGADRRDRRCPKAPSWSRRRSAAASGSCWSQPGDTVEAGDDDRRDRGDEDGMRRSTAPAAGTIAALYVQRTAVARSPARRCSRWRRA